MRKPSNQISKVAFIYRTTDLIFPAHTLYI